MATTWIEADKIAVRNDNAKAPVCIFINTVNAPSTWTPPNVTADVWTTVDLAPYGVPLDATAVFLSGILLISHGTDAGTADVWANFRAPGDTLASGNYQMQTIEAAFGSGQRSNASVWVPVVNGKFEFFWHTNQTSAYPAGSAVGMNLSLQAYTRPSAQVDLSALQTQVNAISASVTALQTSVGTLQTQEASLATSVASLQAIPPGTDSRLTSLINLAKTF